MVNTIEVSEKGGIVVIMVKRMRNIAAIDKRKIKIVSDLCNMAESNNVVKRIIIFGSTASKTCLDSSDIDICYDISCDTRDKRARELSVLTSKICDHNCDIVYYDLIGSNLKHEIDTKGVVVYES